MSEYEDSLWLSHSKMSAYVECPYYFKLTYIDKIPSVKGNYHTALGNGIHKCLEEFYSKGRYELDVLERWWDRVCYEGYIEKNGQAVNPILSDDQYQLTDEERNILFYHGRKLLREYYYRNRHEFGVNEVVATELNFKIPIANGRIILNGYIDRVDRTPSGKLVAVDYKTGREKSQVEVDGDFQLTLYSFALRKLFNEVEGGLYLHYLKSGNKVLSFRGREDFNKLLERIKFVKSGIEQGRFEPKVGNQCRYCYYECPINGNERYHAGLRRSEGDMT